MTRWIDQRALQRFGIRHPLLLAPMAGAGGSALAIAVAGAGGLGALPCASLNATDVEREVATFRAAVPGSRLNLNFFAHTPERATDAAQARWLQRLAPYFREYGIADPSFAPAGGRAPFDADQCALVEALRPDVVSFHFGLPDTILLDRVRATGALVLASATTVAEGVWLEERGCHAVIAQGYEAGGHRGNFLTHDMATQPGTIALVPQMVDALRVPVIAAGGIADGRGMAAALCLGACAVQLGTAFLRADECLSVAAHREAMGRVRDDNTAMTNVLTGRPARGLLNRAMRELGPLSADVLPFPLAGGPLAPLRAATEADGQGDFQPLWSGQAGAMSRQAPAAHIIAELVRQASHLLA